MADLLKSKLRKAFVYTPIVRQRRIYEYKSKLRVYTYKSGNITLYPYKVHRLR